MLSKYYARHWRYAAFIAQRASTNQTIRHCSSLQRDEPSSLEETGANEPLVVVEHFESLTIIGLNRPAKRNALNQQLISSLSEAIANYENDPNARSAVLYGIGGNFCAGLDLEDVSGSDVFKRPVIPLIDMPPRKPIVASISGYAVAEGLILALACDAQIIDDTAVVGLLNRRFGVPLCDDSINRLVAHAGFSQAMNIILTGRLVKAKEAVSIGLASEVTPCGSARGRAISLARSLVKFPQAALLADRAALYAAFGQSDKIRQNAKKQMELLRAQAIKEVATNAGRFKEGIGKHGSSKDLFDFGKEDWLPK